MERVIQFLDELDELFVLLRHVAGTRLRRLAGWPGLIPIAIVATLLPL